MLLEQQGKVPVSCNELVIHAGDKPLSTHSKSNIFRRLEDRISGKCSKTRSSILVRSSVFAPNSLLRDLQIELLWKFRMRAHETFENGIFKQNQVVR